MTALRLPYRSNPGTYRVEGEPRLLNCYAEPLGDDNKGPYSLQACAGLIPHVTEVIGGCRGMIWLEDDQKLYAVFGYFLYDVSTTGGKTQVGLIGGTKPVFLARNDAATTQVLIASEGKIFSLIDGTLALQSYTDDDGNSLFADADGNSRTVVSVTQSGGYFVIGLEDGTFFATTLNSVNTDALRFATAESDPDGLTKAHGQGNTLYLVGTQSIEVWAISGGADFPFSRVQGAQLNFGSLSPNTIVDLDQSVVMVCSDNVVRQIAGYQSKVISSNEVARLIEAETDKTALKAFVYSRGVNKFYCLQGTGWTREFNVATGFWHDRVTGVSEAWLGAYYARAFNKDIFGSSKTGKTFEGSYSTFLEDGQPLIWGFETETIHAFPDAIQFNRLSIDTETGNGPSVDEAGELMLDWSDDEGRSWQGFRRISLGKLGEYGAVVEAWGLGLASRKGRVFRVRISDPITRGIAQIDVDGEPVKL